MLDTQNTWLEAQVVELDVDSSRIFVHYKGYKSKYDEWLDVSSDRTRDFIARIAPLHAHTRRTNATPNPPAFQRVGDRVDVKDSINSWLTGQIIDFDSAHHQVHVKYDHWADKFNEWLDVDSYRIQPLGLFTQAPIQQTKTRGVGGGRVLPSQQQQPQQQFHSAAVSPERLAQFQATQANESHFRHILRARLQCEIVDQKEDGNCLFRSVSHQVYGDAAHHDLVRQSAMDYIEKEQHFFENFIAGETFGQYITRMRVGTQQGARVWA